jgi:hypothetical protein
MATEEEIEAKADEIAEDADDYALTLDAEGAKEFYGDLAYKFMTRKEAM